MSEYKQYCCRHCKSHFLGRVRDRRKGNALFCSRTCANEGNKSIGIFYDKTCRNCGKDFRASSPMSKYCSTKCKTSYTNRIRNVDRRKGDFKKIAELSCEICGYSRSSRDVHHIIPVSKGGLNKPENLISLCPNCHRECHEDHFSDAFLKSLVKKRTI
jgi:5-methylcytosine-specific restriction endonuclease McrA